MVLHPDCSDSILGIGKRMLWSTFASIDTPLGYIYIVFCVFQTCIENPFSYTFWLDIYKFPMLLDLIEPYLKERLRNI